MIAFAGNCKLYAECLYICTGSCLHTVRFLTNSAGDAVSMILTSKTGIELKYVGKLCAINGIAFTANPT